MPEGGLNIRLRDTVLGQEARLHDQMVGASTDPDQLARLTAELAALHEQEEALELEWLEASEAAEG